jgi:putative transposase
MPIQVNALIEWKAADGVRIERVLWVDEDRTGIYTIDIDYEKAWPVFQRYEEMEAALATGSARLIERVDKYLTLLLPDDKYVEKHAARARKNYVLILPLIENGDPRIYNRKTRGRLVAELARVTKRRKTQINTLLRRYWQRGCLPNALYPDYYKCGHNERDEDNGNKRGQTKERKNDPHMSGRPSKTGRKVTAEDQAKFRLGINDFIKTGIVRRLPRAWELTKEKYFKIGEKELSDGTGVPILPPAEDLPSLRQFRYYYYKTRNLKDEIVAIDGEIEFECNNRPTLGDETHRAFGPGAVYQIDATVGDIYLRCYLNRKLIIGRPVIYIVVDVFSRLITGFAVTLEGPNWAGAKLALENAFTDKVAFCKRFGIDISEDDWPAKDKWEALEADNGEVAGYNANSLVDPLGMRVANAPSERPDLKGIVEGRFPIINKLAIEWVPGATRPRRKRRGKDYVLDATLDLNQFRKLFIVSILRYNKRRLEKYRLSKEMLADAVEPIPVEMWKWGMRKLTGKLRAEDPEVLRVNLLPRGRAKITPQGLCFKGVYYIFDQGLHDHWFLRGTGKRVKYVDILYESTVDRIYLRMGKGKRYEECVLTEADRRFQGLDWYEVLEYFALKKAAAKADETNQQQHAAIYNALANRIVSEANEMNKLALADDTRSKKARTEGIKDNRKALKIYERKHGASGLSPKVETDAPALVIPFKRSSKNTSDDGYIPPARPYGELRKAREDAKKNGR